ncbi:MAG: PepSY domain-containing protein [Erysipelotrichaceae bacterium]|nr:PepSY domain-containing protein [Erysipelotrichaceae bacterium]
MEKLKSNRYVQIIFVALAGVVLVSLLTLVPSVTNVDANSDEVVSETEVIDSDQACDIALEHANVVEATFNEITLDDEDNTQVYVIDFTSEDIEYTYKINAITGEVISYESETVETTQTSTTINAERAKLVAMNHAGVTSIENYKVEADTDNDIDIYNIEFSSGNYKYEYIINANDGTIIDSDKSVINTSSTTSSTSTTTSSSSSSSTSSSTSSSSSISESKAKSIAMNHAGVSSVSDYHIKSYTKDNTKVYKVIFTSNNYKYVYEIRQSDGKILDVEKHKTGSSSSSTSSTSGISESEAKSIAMNHAGVSSVSRYEIKLDQKDDVQVYKIEFESGKYEYEYLIRVSDGTILRYEKDD